jgi:hypothetical protein
MRVKFAGRQIYDRIAKRVLLELEQPSSDWTQGLFGIARDGIIKRTRRGIDVDGMRFKPYSPEYAKKKGRSWANLTDSGKLMSKEGFEFQVMRGGNKIILRVYIPDKHHSKDLDHYTLGLVHNFGMGDAPKREFMGLDDAIIKKLNSFSRDNWRKLFKKLEQIY